MAEITEPTVALEALGEVLVATVDSPPVNALSHSVRTGLVAALDRFEKDTASKVLVIICAGRTFIAGADIREFNKPLQEPRLGTLIDRLDRCEKPVVAAIHGTALGGGFEIALACSYRIAAESARVGLPEVKLGLLPGSGGTVRLPRLVGVEQALTMITEGGQVKAGDALERGFVDEVVTGDLRDAALAFARSVAKEGAVVRRTSDLPVPDFEPELLAAKRAELARRYKGLKAPQIAVDLIEMVTKTPFAEAVEKEYRICKDLIASPQSKALRHQFAAEREATKIDGVGPQIKPRAIRKVAVVGPGTMGRGITVCFLNTGRPVALLGRSNQSLDKAVAAIRKVFESGIKRGSMSEADLESRMVLLSPTTDYADLSDADLVIEAVSENRETKEDVLGRLSQTLRPDAIVATNTSFLDIEALADAYAHPENFAGMHFFNPANVMKLLENVRAKRTAADVLATITAIGKELGKVPVMVGRSEGFVANRMLSKRTREAQFLLEEGATPQQVDKVLAGFGFPIGPFALADLAGMDVMAAARAARVARMTPREQACDIVDKLVGAGRLGQKTGSGYYRYGEDRKAQPDPEVDVILAAHREATGRPHREITDEEILERCLYAMVNEAAKILEEGAAARPGDIDVIWTNGFGWPAHLGGPMFWADQIGIVQVRDALEKYSGIVGDEYFKPAPLIQKLAEERRGFYN